MDRRICSHQHAPALGSRGAHLGRHDQTCRSGVDGDIARHEADVAKLCHKLSVLLVAERLDGTGVDDSLVVLETLRNRVLCHDRLSGRRVCRYEDTLIALDRGDGHLLERIQRKGPGSRGLCWGLVLGNRDVVVVWRQGNLMADLMRKHHCLAVLGLRLQSSGRRDLARLLRLEVVGDNGLGLGIALLPLLQLLCCAVLVFVFVCALVRCCGCIRHGRIFHGYWRLDVAVGLSLLVFARRGVLGRAALEDVKHVIIHGGQMWLRSLAEVSACVVHRRCDDGVAMGEIKKVWRTDHPGICRQAMRSWEAALIEPPRRQLRNLSTPHHRQSTPRLCANCNPH